MKISIVIIASNSENTIKKCLESIKDFDEVILYLNNTNDNTKSIARNFKNVEIIDGYFDGFGTTKNRAVSYAKNDWIFVLDSDEIIKKELLSKLKNLDYNNTYIYSFLRDNYYKKTLIKCCGWENDYVLRLFNKEHTKFNNNNVHESLIIQDNSKIIKIKEGLKHYSFNSIEELINKTQYYSTLFAKDSNKKITICKPILSTIFKFIKNYFFQKGFLYGYKGLVISISNANGVFYKYMKLYEKNKDKNES